MTAFADLHTDHLAVARWYADHQDDWPLAPRFDPVTRWYHRLSEAPAAHEVWLLSWLPGQATDLHDHGGSAGAFVVVAGTLTEHTPHLHEPSGPTRLRSTHLPASAGRQFGAHHIHQLGNESDRPAVSVHVYGPALTSMTRYRLDGDELRVTTVDRAGAHW
jgi:predicted metal-dependent enzyme (double-stranded beta helix superfamily)